MRSDFSVKCLPIVILHLFNLSRILFLAKYNGGIG